MNERLTYTVTEAAQVLGVGRNTAYESIRRGEIPNSTAERSVDAPDALSSALAYAQRGKPVLLLHGIENGTCTCGNRDCGSSGKHPRTRNGVHDATTDPQIIRGWFARHPQSNVGIATGEASGLVVLDVDPRHGGTDSLDYLVNRYGPLPDTVEVTTGGGGRHIYFKYPGGETIPNSNGRLGSGLDIKSNGGYVVAPPSKHESGRLYAWKHSSHPDDVEPCPMPSWLIANTVRDGRAASDSSSSGDGTDPRHVLDGVEEGERNDTLFRYGCQLRLLGLGWREANVLLAEAASNCHPPLPDTEVTSILESAWRNRDDDEVPFRVETFTTWEDEVDAAPDPGWIAEPVWPGDAYGVLAAESKAGKTWAQLDLGVSVATGTPWMNTYPTQQGTVVIFLGEGGERNMVRRVRAILTDRGLDSTALGERLFVCHRVPHLTEDAHLAGMRRQLARIGLVRLVILDPLYLAAGGANGASLYDMGIPLAAAQHVAQDAGAALVVVHHFNQTGKGDHARRMSGAGPEEWGRVLATVKVANTMIVDDGRTELADLAWSFTGSEIASATISVRRTISVESLTDLKSAMSYTIAPADPTTPASGTTQIVLDAIARQDDWLSVTEIELLVHPQKPIGRRTIQVTLKDLHTQKLIERKGKKAKGYKYRLPLTPDRGGAQ